MALFQSESLNREMGTFTLTSPALAIDETDAEDIKTGNFTYVYDGVFKSKTAAAKIDLSDTTYADGGSLVIEDDETAKIYVMIDADGDHTTYLLRADEYTWEPDALVIGYVEVLNESDADFTVGTTDLSASGVTDTYVNLLRYDG